MAYRLIIADDELPIRRGLVSIIDWSALGFLVTGVFPDGSETIAYMKDNPVDAVLCDIMMKKVSGLDVARWMRENRPDVPLVLLSAYEDFKFAQEAVSLKVFRYLTKPTQVDELVSTFGQIADALRERKARTSIQQTRSALVVRMVLNLFSSGRISEEEGRLFLSQAGCEDARAVLLPLPHTQALPPLPDGIEAFFFDKGLLMWNGKADDALLTLAADQITKAKMLSKADIRFDSLAHLVSGMAGDLRPRLTSADEQRFLERLNQLIDEGSYSLLPDFFTRLQSTRMSPAFFQLCACVMDIRCASRMTERGLNIEPLAEDQLFRALQETENRDALMQWVQTASGAMERGFGEKEALMLKKIDDYLLENMHRGVNLPDVARLVYLSPSHFSRTFKAKTGISFVEYQMKMRISRARDLLLSTGKSISQIARDVGYQDVHYFMKLFKQEYNMSPTEYRRYSHE